ncbi:hypothetical protein Tco_1364068 [Tanacetum coccineum]
MDGWLSFICRCGESMVELINRPSFNSSAKAVLGNKSVDKSGKYGTCNAGAESVGVSDCNKGFDDVGLRYVKRTLGLLDSTYGSSGKRQASKALKEIFFEFKTQRFIRSLGGRGGRAVFSDMVKSLGPMSIWEGQFELILMERIDAEGPSLEESLENEDHLDVDSCDSDSPKNVNNDLVSPSSRVLREEDVREVESNLVDSFEEGEIRDDSVLYNEWGEFRDGHEIDFGI